MSPTVNVSTDRTPLNTVQARMAKAEIRVNVVAPIEDAVDDAEMLSVIAIALRRAEVKQSYAAALARVKESQLSGALNGHGAFNIRWLWCFPPAFWNEYLPLLRAKKESSEDAKRQERKERLIRAIELLISEVG